MSAEQAVVFESDELRLEGRVALPPGAIRAVVVCHPHPQYGGDMDNPIVRVIVAHLAAAGVATLRFNFRGVGDSEGHYGAGVGEATDARAAVALLRERTGAAHTTLAGYSFGAMVALRAGYDRPDVDRLIAIALPLPMFDASFLAACDKPKLFLLGDRDQYCPLATLERTVAEWRGPNRLEPVAGADHFLGNAAREIGGHVVRFVTDA